MGAFDWREFLRQWNEDVFGSAAADEVPRDVRAGGWLGAAGASEEQLCAAEQRLGIRLPPSYRSFLAASDGWKYVSHAVPTLWGVAQIDWFGVYEPDWVESWGRPSSNEPTPDDEYFSYAKSEAYRPEHLRQTLQIGPMGDAAFLLINPQVISKDGEWECWILASWIPGVRRYRSFQEMMELDHARLIGADLKQKVGLIGGLPDEFIGSPGSPDRRKKVPVLSSDGPPVGQLLAALDDRELAMRLFPKAIRDAKRRRPPGESDDIDARRRVTAALGERRDAKAVPALVKLLSENEHRLVRREATGALGKIGGKEAIEALFRELEEGDFFAAVHELKTLAPERLKDPLLTELKKGSLIMIPAVAGVLAELNEKRSLPILAAFMQEKKNDAHFARMVGKSIAMFGGEGLNALKELMKSDDPVLRQSVVNAIGETHRTEAREVMRGLLNDPDPLVRDSADFWMGLLPGPR